MLKIHRAGTHLLDVMTCFNFFKKEKVEPRSSNSTLAQSSNSALTDMEKRSESKFNSQNLIMHTEQVSGGGGSESNSHNVSDASTESFRRSSYQSLLRTNNLRVFTYSELKTGTMNFHRAAKLGEGGFGCVYKGVINCSGDPERKLHVAVKQLGTSGLQGHKEWVTEVNVLGVVDHPNLVKLVGYCADDSGKEIQRLLVYEYMPKRSVEDHLSARYAISLPWSRRLRIAQDSARGLAYLHEGMHFQIIFRDFKSSNILLDDQWNAKLSDFGLARLGPEEGRSHISTAAVGTLGYAAPEYIQMGHLTFRSDIFGYGVFLYELITGRRPIDWQRPKHEQKLLEWIRPYLADSKKFQQILDPRLEWNSGSIKLAKRLATVANRCLVSNAKARPKMSEVLEMVNQIVSASEKLGDPRVTKWSSTKETMGERKEGNVGENIWEVKRLSCLWSPKLVSSC